MANSDARFDRTHVRAWLTALALGCVWLSANAANSDAIIRGGALWSSAVNGSTTTVASGGAGRLMVIKPPSAAPLTGGGWTPAGNYGVAPGPSGSVSIGTSGNLVVAEKNVPVNIQGNLAKEAIIGGVVGCATGGAIGCVLGVGTPLALAYLTTSGGVRETTAGSAVWEQRPAGCNGTTCARYNFAAGIYGAGSPAMTDSTQQGLCNQGAAWYAASGQSGAAGTTATWDGTVNAPNGGVCRHFNAGGVPTFSQSVSKSTIADSGTWNPATPQSIRDALIASGAPPPPGIVPELGQTGVDWNKIWPGYANAPAPNIGTPSVSGPSSITGPREVTTNPNGSTSTRQSSTPLTYSGPSVTAGPATTTTTTTNTDGSPGGTTTTTTTAGTENPKEETPTQCDKYPNSLGCAELDTPESTIPKRTETVSYTAENTFGGGSCPADRNMSFQSMAGSYKVVNWSGFCAYALPVRALVILLATFAAFLIVMPGKEART